MRKYLLLASLCLTPAAMAQSVGLNAQRFAPAPGGDLNFNHVEGVGVTGTLTPAIGLFFNYAHRPLIATRDSDSVDLLHSDLGLDITAALGFGKRFQLGVALPVTLSQAAGPSSDLIAVPQVAGQALGDLRIEPKFKFCGGRNSGFALALPLSVPTGSPENYQGEAGPTFEPRLLLELSPGRLRVGANLGYLIRQPQGIFNLTATNELRYGAGLSFAAVPERLDLIAEAFGGAALGPDSDTTIRTLPLEGNLAGRLHFGNHAITLGAGPGITIGYGTPTWRAFLGYTFTPFHKAPPPDKDGDGILDAVDRCPAEPEDKDEFQDEDGCPELDNDQDGIPDSTDKCPNQPEDSDGFQDADGCAEPDNDNDGIPDTADKCPLEAEDKDSFQDDDGCPEADNDGDGLLDGQDSCPNQAEDKDGLADEDGCPEVDFDRDGIPDEQDKCPRDVEVINGVNDEDGCPDEGKSKVNVTATKIEILEKVFFATAKADILPQSFSVLKQVASVLKANLQITKLAIEGHTDDQGADDYNLKLSQARTESVMKFLADNGVDTGRLEAHGYGESRPIASNKNEKGRSMNRRVEFNIIEIDGKPVEATKAVEEKPAAPKTP